MPTPQEVQAEGSSAVVEFTRYFPPAQAVQEGEAAPEYFPASHSMQVDAVVAPSIELKVPARHAFFVAVLGNIVSVCMCLACDLILLPHLGRTPKPPHASAPYRTPLPISP